MFFGRRRKNAKTTHLQDMPSICLKFYVVFLDKAYVFSPPLLADARRVSPLLIQLLFAAITQSRNSFYSIRIFVLMSNSFPLGCGDKL